jgi:hypothetical protein
MSAGRDVITKENQTHIETKTRHVEVKEGWSLFRVDNNATTSSGLSGLSGIGIIGEVLLILLFIALFLMAFKRWMERRDKSDSYKTFFRAQRFRLHPRPNMLTTEADIHLDNRNQTPLRPPGRSTSRAAPGSIGSARL